MRGHREEEPLLFAFTTANARDEFPPKHPGWFAVVLFCAAASAFSQPFPEALVELVTWRRARRDMSNKEVEQPLSSHVPFTHMLQRADEQSAGANASVIDERMRPHFLEVVVVPENQKWIRLV